QSGFSACGDGELPGDAAAWKGRATPPPAGHFDLGLPNSIAFGLAWARRRPQPSVSWSLSVDAWELKKSGVSRTPAETIASNPWLVQPRTPRWVKVSWVGPARGTSAFWGGMAAVPGWGGARFTSA